MSTPRLNVHVSIHLRREFDVEVSRTKSGQARLITLGGVDSSVDLFVPEEVADEFFEEFAAAWQSVEEEE